MAITTALLLIVVSIILSLVFGMVGVWFTMSMQKSNTVTKLTINSVFSLIFLIAYGIGKIAVIGSILNLFYVVWLKYYGG